VQVNKTAAAALKKKTSCQKTVALPKASNKTIQQKLPKTLDPPWGKITIMYFLGLKPKSYHNSIQTQQLNTKEIEDTHNNT
jgi:hypothetical protein